MHNREQFGANIRSLRKAYGETQEQLGQVLHVEKNTVSSYENGKREPDRETLDAIAKHFLVTVDELLNADYSSIGEVHADREGFFRYIYIFLPIISSEEALANAHFRKGVEAHRALYDRLREGDYEAALEPESAVDAYTAAAEENAHLEAEAAANLLDLMYLPLMAEKNLWNTLNLRTAPIAQMAREDAGFRQAIDALAYVSGERGDGAEDPEADAEMGELRKECLRILRKSGCHAELAEFHLALQYLWNITDSGLGTALNGTVGAEMMYTYAELGNPYAARFIRYTRRWMAKRQ
ncbi:MAG: helix-turn-helix transcriptional regulator [Lachnospiraceae bacterium]|nr:helix-turn-helix transcriptional regulator [Lachnospiraceae bacterium]